MVYYTYTDGRGETVMIATDYSGDVPTLIVALDGSATNFVASNSQSWASNVTDVWAQRIADASP